MPWTSGIGGSRAGSFLINLVLLAIGLAVVVVVLKIAGVL